MTGPELRALRGDRTREKFADDLGDCSASTINKWERGINPIPQWVADKLLSNVSLELPLDDLAALVNHATKTGQKFETLLSQALRDYLITNKAKVVPMPKTAHHEAPTEQLRVGEEPALYTTPKRKARGA